MSRCRELLGSVDEIENKEALFYCYKNKLIYNSGYDTELEDTLDIIHDYCYEGLVPPWWVDLLD